MKPLKEWDSVDPSPPLGPALLIISYRHSSHLIDPLYIFIGLSDIPKCGHIIFDTLKPNHVDWMQATRIIFSLYLDLPLYYYIYIYIYRLKGQCFYDALELLALLRADWNLRVLTTKTTMWPPYIFRFQIY